MHPGLSFLKFILKLSFLWKQVHDSANRYQKQERLVNDRMSVTKKIEEFFHTAR